MKSLTVMEQLLLVKTTQTNELIASFQNRFNKLKSDHDDSLRKLLRNSKSERHNNQTSIDRITKNHNKQISQLESEYRVSLTHVKNQHNKKISCMRKQVSALEASIDKKDSRRKALENEVHDLNEWVLELDNERITAETERKGAVTNERSAKRKYACAQSKCRSAKKKYAQKYAHMESKCSELQNEIEQLNDWVFELDNKKKSVLNHQRTAEKMYARAKSDAYMRLQKFREERLSRKELEEDLLCVKKALRKTEQELEMAKLLMENSQATKCRMKKEWTNNYDDGRRTRGGSRHWPPWVVQMICELLINGTAPTAVPSTIQSIYETLYNEPPEELPSLNFVRECQVVVEIIGETMVAIKLGHAEIWDQLWTDSTTRRQIPFTALIIGIIADSGNIDPIVVSSCIFMEDERSETQVDGIVNKVNQ